MPFFAGVRLAARHANFRRLIALFLCGRIAMDLVAAMLILYFTLWLGRSGDFELDDGLFFVVVLASLPFWVRLASAPREGARVHDRRGVVGGGARADRCSCSPTGRAGSRSVVAVSARSDTR